jgi:hypothetical protein
LDTLLLLLSPGALLAGFIVIEETMETLHWIRAIVGECMGYKIEWGILPVLLWPTYLLPCPYK